MDEDNKSRSALGDVYDRQMTSLRGKPGCEFTGPSTLTVLSKVFERTTTFIVQTCRQEEEGDTVFVQYIGAEGSLRLALPPAVADKIASQRDAISAKNRKKAAKAAAATRKARGIVPNFGKKK